MERKSKEEEEGEREEEIKKWGFEENDTEN